MGASAIDTGMKDNGSNFFLPVQIISRVFRGKYLEELKKLQEEDKFVFYGTAEKYRNHYVFQELIDSCFSMDWIPHCKKTFNGAQSVIGYSGKYTHRIAVSNHRILRMDEPTVIFSVKDYRNEGKWKELTLPGVEFIRRFLMRRRYLSIFMASGSVFAKPVAGILGNLSYTCRCAVKGCPFILSKASAPEVLSSYLFISSP